MRVIVVGGNDLDWDFFRDKLLKLLSKLHKPTLLLRGGKGRTDTDKFVERFSTMKNGIDKYVSFTKDAEQHGPDAAGVRADEMVDSGAKALIAFVSEDSADADADTQVVIDAAGIAGLKIKIVGY